MPSLGAQQSPASPRLSAPPWPSGLMLPSWPCASPLYLGPSALTLPPFLCHTPYPSSARLSPWTPPRHPSPPRYIFLRLSCHRLCASGSSPRQAQLCPGISTTPRAAVCSLPSIPPKKNQHRPPQGPCPTARQGTRNGPPLHDQQLRRSPTQPGLLLGLRSSDPGIQVFNSPYPSINERKGPLPQGRPAQSRRFFCMYSQAAKPPLADTKVFHHAKPPNITEYLQDILSLASTRFHKIG